MQCGERPNDSRSGERCGCCIPLGYKAPWLVGGMSVFTMIMTIPRVLAIWVGHQAAGRFDPVVECVFCLRPSLVMVRNPAA